jgi:hypothetical protein
MTIVRKAAANDNAQIIDTLISALEQAAATTLSTVESFTALEDVLLAASNEFVRRELERWLQALSNRLGEEVSIDKVRHRRHQPGSARYFSLCGPLDVTRWTYRLKGARNGPTQVPLELHAGLIYGATPALANALAQGHAKAPVRSVEQDLIAARRAPPCRSTMDRIARTIGLDVHGIVEIVEPVVRAEEEIPSGATAINLGLDRTTVPMEEPADGPADSRGAKPKITVRYRMAYVGTVCITNADGETLRAWRYAAAAHDGPHAVLRRMMADLDHALTSRPRLKIGVVQDGAAEMWNLMREALAANPRARKKRWRETVDRYHFMERVGKALEALYPKEPERRHALLQQWRIELGQSDSTAKNIRRVLEALAVAQSDERVLCDVISVISAYVLCEEHFHYASLARHGLHSGSGVTEGACKSLIAARAKRSGQRWRPNASAPSSRSARSS